MTDHAHMGAALALARRSLGSTWPNPSVGCVIVNDGRVVGRGTTAPGGRPHAEVVALAMAGQGARGATAYVTLEPCSHYGQTPPCVNALVAAGVARVVVACNDPDPRVNGRGLARLHDAGITVTTGVRQAEAEALQAGFFTRVHHGRPMVTLKLATTLDGRIAAASGESQWITGPEARRAAHALRGTHDATLVGIGTVLADDPALTCRIPGYRRTPEVRIVLDSQLRTPLTAHLVTTARETPTWIIHGPAADPIRRTTLEAAGVHLLGVGTGPGGLVLPEVLAALGKAGLTRVLVEGGSRIAGALLGTALVDRVAWFHAPSILGADGLPAVEAFGDGSLAGMTRFWSQTVQGVGEDVATCMVAVR